MRHELDTIEDEALTCICGYWAQEPNKYQTIQAWHAHLDGKETP
jgi:hypothetical protein